MDITAIVPGSIVVGIDGSESAAQALDWAVDQALAERRPLALLHGLGPARSVWLDQAGVDQRTWVDAVLADAHEFLRVARERVERRAPTLEVTEAIRLEDPRQALIHASEVAATVVVGSRGRGPIASLLLGSVGLAVTRHAACPVVVVRPGNPGLVRRGVLVGVDATRPPTPTLELAFRQASQRDLPLTVMHCFWDELAAAGMGRVDSDDRADEERLLLAEFLGGMREKFPDVWVRTEVCRGLPADCLVRGSRRMNLVVVGTHRGGPWAPGAVGSLAAAVVEHADCPVAVVPEPVPE